MTIEVRPTDSRDQTAWSRNWLLVFSVAILFVALSGQSASADGSWGSSRGGWGSGGSWGSGGGGSFGCRGGLFANQPVRTLLSRVGVGLGNGIAGIGNGIANVFERGPLRNGRFGSRGGWGCSGGSNGFGSHGGWGGSTGSYAGNWGCTGGLAAAAPVYGSPVLADNSFVNSGLMLADNSTFQGFTNVIGQDVVGQSYGCTGSVSAYVDPGSVYLNSGTPVNAIETSAPMLDYGYFGTQFGTIGVPTDATMMDGQIITAPMMQEGPTLAPGEGSATEEGYYDGEDSVEDPPIGASGENTTRYVPRGSSILSLDVPENAQVYINDKLTKTQGARRSYASRNLVVGQEYRYRVKVVAEVDGKTVTKSRVVTMLGGRDDLVAFNFTPVVTRLLVSVPEDAKVIIDGKETTTTGSTRTFSTDKLKSGKWEDYSVEVSVVRNGETVTRRESFDLIAGEFKFLQFDFDRTAVSDLASN